MNAIVIIGMGVGVFFMYEAWKNELDPATLLKSILTSTSPADSEVGSTLPNGSSTNTLNANPGGLPAGGQPVGFNPGGVEKAPV